MSTVVYIGAVGRSGTTLLERTLSTSPSYVALGETVHLWDRGVADHESCGCTKSFDECEFWSEVGRRAFGGWQQVDLDQIRSDRRRVDRNRYIPWLIAPALAPASFREARRRLLGILDDLYRAIDELTDDAVLIDSSKHPSYLFLLRSMASHDVRLLHVVRDPRGVAHSWAKQVARPESGASMEQLSTGRAIGRWTSHNVLLQLAPLAKVRRRRISYGRFVADPSAVGSVAGDLADHVGAEPLAVEGTTVTLGCDHTVSGNPSRFRTGPIEVRPDDAWRSSMPSRKQKVVGALTTPLRQVYCR